VNLGFDVVVRGDVGRITLGPRVNLQDGVIVHTDYDATNDLEEGVVAGHGAILHGRRIGQDCLIGMRATVLSGSELGAECIVAAGGGRAQGVIVPPRAAGAGGPGKGIQAVTEEESPNNCRLNAPHLEKAERYLWGG